MIEAKVVAHSISEKGKEIVTLQLRYPRFIHAEFMTHRVFSRNSASSRAIPVAKMIEQVRSDPAEPVHWGKNQPGMQAREEVADIGEARRQWRLAANVAADRAEFMNAMGLHKQIVNRILEPWQWMQTIVTATEWENFFDLRCHPDAQPEIQALAVAMRTAIRESVPVQRPYQAANTEESWHLPYITHDERRSVRVPKLLAMSVARCARVSYLKHDGTHATFEEDVALFDRLVGSTPIHASPCEHQAAPMQVAECQSRNLLGWLQFRQLLEVTKASGEWENIFG
jgi:thymidylate synthase ThyX